MAISINGLLQKLIRSDDGRLTRVHDRKGNRIPFNRLLWNGPKALLSYLLLLVTGKRPVLPWISYSAMPVIDQALRKDDSAVLEFGSGMSTLWFSTHAKRVCSVEHDSAWFHVVDSELRMGDSRGQIEYRLATEKEDYCRNRDDVGRQFDLMLVDGPWRAECLANNMSRIKPGGIIYLDNSDADSSSGEPGEIDRAVEILGAFAKEKGADVQVYTDFCPTCLFAIQGILVRLPN